MSLFRKNSYFSEEAIVTTADVPANVPPETPNIQTGMFAGLQLRGKSEEPMISMPKSVVEDLYDRMNDILVGSPRLAGQLDVSMELEDLRNVLYNYLH